MKSKKLGVQSQIADSILRYVIEHYGETDVIFLYNNWLNEVASESGYPMAEPQLVGYALEQFEACVATPKQHLVICKEIEDSI